MPSNFVLCIKLMQNYTFSVSAQKATTLYSLVACNYNAYIKYVFGCVFLSLGHP